MLTDTWKKYKSLSPTLKSIMYTYWIYEFAQYILSIFMGIFIFDETRSIEVLAVYYLIYCCTILLGFSGWGALTAHWQINLRTNHLRAFFVYILAFLWLWFFRGEVWHFLVFGAISGLALGMYWMGHHSFEMIETSDDGRDFYSSLLGVGAIVLRIIAPLFATITFLVSKQLGRDTYDLLFWILPFTYLLVIPFLRNLPDFTPHKISLAEWKRLIKTKKYRPVRWYIVVESMGWAVGSMILPMIALAALGTVVNFGWFQTVIGVIAIIALLVQGRFQKIHNRLLVLFCLLSLYFLLNGALYLWTLSALVYVIFSMVSSLADPLKQTVKHVFSLRVMDLLKCDEEHFFAGMLYREILLWLGRICPILLILLGSLIWKTNVPLTYLGIAFLQIQVVIFWFVAKRLFKTTV